MKALGGYFSWSIYVHKGKINQIGLSTQQLSYGKYAQLLNYGKYNLTYTIYGTNGNYGCPEKAGGGIAEFGQDISPTSQEKLRSIVSDSILYRGNNINGAAEYIKQKAEANLSLGYWFVIIADPTTEFGYDICRAG